MDAENERNPKREEWYLRECLEERNQLELRLYEVKEVEAYSYGGDKVAYYRLRRFFASLVGFHEVSDPMQVAVTNDLAYGDRYHQGSLDLSGRHASRYEELSMKWQEFFIGVSKATIKISKVKPQRRDEKANRIMNECLAKWNLDGGMPAFELMTHLGIQFLIDVQFIH